MGSQIFLVEPAIDDLRKLWKRSGMPRTPKKALDTVTGIIQECEKITKRWDKQIKKEIEKRNERHKQRGIERGIWVGEKTEEAKRTKPSEQDTPQSSTS